MADSQIQKGLDFDLNKEPDEEVQCTVCMEPVENFRGRAILQCGHKFHLDCIGSAFNVKGYMKCPNCRDVEWKDWMYSLSTGDIRADEDLVNWIANHHPFFVLPMGYRLCALRGLVGPDNNTVGGQVVFGLANQDYYQEMEQQGLNPDGQTEVTARPSSCPVSIDVDARSPRSVIVDTLREIYSLRMPPNAFQQGAFNPRNAIPIRMFGMDHTENFNFVELNAQNHSTQNHSTPNTAFSGHTFSSSSTQRVTLFNQMVTEPNPTLIPCTEGTQVPFELCQEDGTPSPLAPAVMRALSTLTPPPGHPSTISTTSADILYLTGVTMFNQETPEPNSPQPPQENGNGPQENGPQ